MPRRWCSASLAASADARRWRSASLADRDEDWSWRSASARGQRGCQALAFGFVGLQLGGGTVPLCPNLAEAAFQSGALGRSASQLEVGLNALTQIAEVGTDPCRRAGRGGRGEEFLQGRKLIFADREYSQAVVMKEGEVRVRAAKLVPKAPDPEIPLPDVDVVKQDDAAIGELGVPELVVMPNGVIGMAAVDMQQVDGAVREVGERLIESRADQARE